MAYISKALSEFCEELDQVLFDGGLKFIFLVVLAKGKEVKIVGVFDYLVGLVAVASLDCQLEVVYGVAGGLKELYVNHVDKYRAASAVLYGFTGVEN